VFTEGGPAEIQTSNKLESHLPQNDRPVASEIAQQYSSATFISWRRLSRQEKIRRTLQKKKLFFFLFKNWINLKFHNLKLLKWWAVLLLLEAGRKSDEKLSYFIFFSSVTICS